jgi:NADPH-dependent 2,4-dienoyl-CoA reductase/sulfur reductase-like enzyme
MRRILIVGASLAGLRAAEALRSHGFDGELTLVGDEPHQPYNRPALSKQLLAGTIDEGGCAFRHDVEAEWRLGTRARALDLPRRLVTLAGGEELPFDGLLIATGSSARPAPPPLRDVEGHLTLRGLEDARALQSAAASAERAVVVGAGFIGCEVASSLRARGVDVSLVDVAPVPMRQLGEEIGKVCADLHLDHGVHLYLNAGVRGFDGQPGDGRIELADGRMLETDLLLVATGAAPNVGWLEGSGLQLSPGIVCDATLAARGAENVFAAGDVVAWPHPLAGDELVRVEHWTNAAEQGRHAAANLLAPPAERLPYASVPSFWSDQYEVKIQAVGFLDRAEEMRIVEGSEEERCFVAIGEREGRLVSAIAFSSPQRIPWYRRQIAAGRQATELLGEVGG